MRNVLYILWIYTMLQILHQSPLEFYG